MVSQNFFQMSWSSVAQNHRTAASFPRQPAPGQQGMPQAGSGQAQGGISRNFPMERAVQPWHLAQGSDESPSLEPCGCGTWGHGEHGGSGLIIGLDDLRDLFQL